jgi:hypothetical protein
MRAGQPIASFSGSKPTQKTDWFGRLAAETAIVTGKPSTFLLAVLVVLGWAITGPIFRYKYGHYNRHLPDGISYSGDAKPRHSCFAD